MLRVILELSRVAVSTPWKACLCFLHLFSFALIFFAVLALSYLISDDISRYDFMSLLLTAIYSVFFICGWRNTKQLLTHSVVHCCGLLFEVYKVGQLSWVYPDQGWLMLWDVPFYSGFMYIALVDFICQAMRYSKFQLMKEVPWKLAALLCSMIYCNFFITHVTDLDFRYLLVAVSAICLYKFPVRMTINKITIHLNLLSLMIVLACMVWLGENLATLGGAWLYLTQLNSWVFVSSHKLVSWYLLGQFFVFVVIFFNDMHSWFVSLFQFNRIVSNNLIKE